MSQKDDLGNDQESESKTDQKVDQNSGWLDLIKWDEKGLIPAIAQEAETGKLLMVAWMNREALELTVEEGRAIYWSRSRKKDLAKRRRIWPHSNTQRNPLRLR